jgi:acetyl-CoA acetyltransferase
MALHGISDASLVRVAQKAFANGALNEFAWRREALSFDQIASSPMLSDPLRKLMFCSPSEGAAAVIVCDAAIASRFSQRPIYVRAATLRTRGPRSFEVFNPSIELGEGIGATSLASQAAYEMAGVGPEDIQIAQLQDTESGAEIMHMAENGLCRDGDQERMLADGDTTLSGRLPVNTDGGCLANGEPVGASGLRQICENVRQMRGQAGGRQVGKAPKLAYTHVYGAPGVSSVTILGV